MSRFLRNALVYKTSKKGRVNEIGEGAFASFGGKTGTGKGRYKAAGKGVAVYMLGPPGRIRQRLLLQRILDNPEGCRQRGRNGSSLGRFGEVMSKQATGEG
jgi:hypothetical protein